MAGVGNLFAVNKKIRIKNLKVIFFLAVFLSACNINPDALDYSTATALETTQKIREEYTQEPTHTIQPSPTPLEFFINSDFPKLGVQGLLDVYDDTCKNFSIVDLEDIKTGRLLDFEQSFLSENPVFNDQVQTSKIVISTLRYSMNYGSYKADLINLQGGKDSQLKAETRPLKVFSFYLFQDDKLFSDLGINPIINDGTWYDEKWPFWIITWAYHNPDGSTTLGHSLVEIFDYVNLVDSIDSCKDLFHCDAYWDPKGNGNPKNLYKPAPEFLYYDINIAVENQININHLMVHIIHESYPELKPKDEHIKSWVSSQVMPTELQTKLFGLATSIQSNYWKSNYFYWQFIE